MKIQRVYEDGGLTFEIRRGHMSINRDKPDLWKNDILQSVDLYKRKQQKCNNLKTHMVMQYHIVCFCVDILIRDIWVTKLRKESIGYGSTE